MSEAKEYVAIQEFSLNINNGKETDIVKVGDRLTFDGLYVTFKDKQGMARPLSKVIGEWIKVAEDSGSAEVRVVQNPTVSASTVSRNVTGGKIVEHSDFPSDPLNKKDNRIIPSDNLQKIVEQADRLPEAKMSNGKREVTSDIDDIAKEIIIINADDDEVMKVKVPTHDASTVANKRGVEVEDKGTDKLGVISMEESVVKSTNYSGQDNTEKSVKRATLDYESAGVVVKKTASSKNTAKSKVSVDIPDETIVATVSEPAIQKTEVSSSTQADLETIKKTPKKKVTQKAPVKKAITKKKVIVETAGQEAEVVGKVTKDDKRVESTDGIVSKVTVGSSSESEEAGVVFSRTDDFDESSVEAIVGNSEAGLDLSGMDDTDFGDGDIITEAESSGDIDMDTGDDIDLNDILADV